MYIDNTFLAGTLNMVVRDENGKVKQHKTVRNKVMDQGLAHIVGRMIDDTHGMKFDAGERSHMLPKAMRFMGIGTGSTPNQTGASAGNEWCLESEQTINQFAMFGPKDGIKPVRATGTAVLTGGVVTGIRITNRGLGYDSSGGAITVTIGVDSNSDGVDDATGGSGATATATIVNTFVDEITITAGGSGYDHATAVPTVSFALPPGLAANGDVSSSALMSDNTNVNTATGISSTDHETEAGFVGSGSPVVSAGKTFNGRVDMSADARNYATGELTYLGQGDTDASSLLLTKETAGTTAEGTYFTDANGTVQRTTYQGSGSQTHAANFYQKSVGGTLIKQKKVGKKLIFIAVFPPNTPSNDASLAITEAGIFNEGGPGNTAIKSADGDGRKSYEEYKYSGTDAAGTHRLREQTMLCRTVFAVVTKQQADTLQITWTIEFSDNTT